MGSHPTIVHPFNIPIHLGRFQFEFSGFGIAVLLAFTIAHVVSERELRRRGYELEARQFGDVLLAAVVGTLVGGKLYFVSVITHDWHDLFSRSGFVWLRLCPHGCAGPGPLCRWKRSPSRRYGGFRVSPWSSDALRDSTRDACFCS